MVSLPYVGYHSLPIMRMAAADGIPQEAPGGGSYILVTATAF